MGARTTALSLCRLLHSASNFSLCSECPRWSSRIPSFRSLSFSLPSHCSSAAAVGGQPSEAGTSLPLPHSPPRATTAKRQTGLHKSRELSGDLSAFLGTPEMSTIEVMKAVWKYIKVHNLQDPSNKKNILCDARLKQLLQKDEISMFEMTKVLNKNIHHQSSASSKQ